MYFHASRLFRESVGEVRLTGPDFNPPFLFPINLRGVTLPALAQVLEQKSLAALDLVVETNSLEQNLHTRTTVLAFLFAFCVRAWHLWVQNIFLPTRRFRLYSPRGLLKCSLHPKHEVLTVVPMR